MIIESTKSDDLSDPSSDKVRQILDETILLIGIHNIQSYKSNGVVLHAKLNVCHTLANVGQFEPKLFMSRQCWLALVKFGQSWSVLVVVGQHWPALVPGLRQLPSIVLPIYFHTHSHILTLVWGSMCVHQELSLDLLLPTAYQHS